MFRKLDFKLRDHGGRNMRDWCVPNKGTGVSKDKEPEGVFGNNGGVSMPAPIRYQFNMDGAGKPEVHRKGRAT
jgi:hypothetical protein